MTDNLQIGLRVPEERNIELDRRAAKMGITKNALIQVCIELGLKVLDGQVTIALSPSE